MSKQNWKQVVSAAARILLACAVVSVQAASAQDSTAQGRPKPVATQTSEKQAAPAANANARIEEPQTERAQGSGGERQSGNGSHEGIKVHGHWTIEVRNPDGSIVSHREFENALSTPASALSALLSREGAAGQWVVNLDNYVNGAPSPGLCGNSGNCLIAEPGNSVSGPVYSNNLIVAAPSGTWGGVVTLSGTVNVSSAGTILNVSSRLTLCPPSVTTLVCSTQAPSVTHLFTSAALNPSVSVAAGQTVALTVTFTFS